MIARPATTTRGHAARTHTNTRVYCTPFVRMYSMLFNYISYQHASDSSPSTALQVHRLTCTRVMLFVRALQRSPSISLVHITLYNTNTFGGEGPTIRLQLCRVRTVWQHIIRSAYITYCRRASRPTHSAAASAATTLCRQSPPTIACHNIVYSACLADNIVVISSGARPHWR